MHGMHWKWNSILMMFYDEICQNIQIDDLFCSLLLDTTRNRNWYAYHFAHLNISDKLQILLNHSIPLSMQNDFNQHKQEDDGKRERKKMNCLFVIQSSKRSDRFAHEKLDTAWGYFLFYVTRTTKYWFNSAVFFQMIFLKHIKCKNAHTTKIFWF